MKFESQARYDKVNTTQFKMKLNTKTDADVLDWLDKQPNKQGKIKELIRKEIKRGEHHEPIKHDENIRPT